MLPAIFLCFALVSAATTFPGRQRKFKIRTTVDGVRKYWQQHDDFNPGFGSIIGVTTDASKAIVLSRVDIWSNLGSGDDLYCQLLDRSDTTKEPRFITHSSLVVRSNRYVEGEENRLDNLWKFQSSNDGSYTIYNPWSEWTGAGGNYFAGLSADGTQVVIENTQEGNAVKWTLVEA